MVLPAASCLSDPDSSTSRQGRYFCAEGRPEELHTLDVSGLTVISHLCCLLHRRRWNDKPLESYGLQLRGQSYHVGVLLVSEDVCTECEEKGYRGREQQQEAPPRKCFRLWSLSQRSFFPLIVLRLLHCFCELCWTYGMAMDWMLNQGHILLSQL